MATKQKVSMPNPGWIFFWVFSIVLFIFLSFHHGNYDVEDVKPLPFQKTQPPPPKLQPSVTRTERGLSATGPLIADTKL